MKIIKNLHYFSIYINEYSLILSQSLYDRDYLSNLVINLVIRPGHQTKIGPVKYQNGVQKRI